MKRKFKSVRPKIDVTNQCYRCKKFYNDKDVVILEEGEKVPTKFTQEGRLERRTAFEILLAVLERDHCTV